ncbi:Regulator of RNase E activity RraA [Anaerovirgula multivorans]|uniref:Putative 4-hydroxy-4-methyl-2-oxoglutarate aldolase n=1 Tax=Anaerovirgula multivorans TaxID=312168 RepID=A0A239L9J2_9FIRM|nr:RraA family protein [Anaerovirgula multivorans]SNT26184.1 Regulator of RNase E activity RraA [Anaerovirgula multivorans]
MLKANIGCRIVIGYERTDKALVEKFRDLPVANIGDCMNRVTAVHQDIRPMNNTPLLGTAFTVKVPQGDNLMFHKAMDLAQPGDIIVIDAGGMKNRAILGELMINYCKIRGVAGVVVDGSIRDYDSISQMDFPVYARGVNPNGPYKNGPGEIGTVISFGGQIVSPGDIVVGDADGIVFIRPKEAEALAEKVKAVSEKEKDIMETMKTDGTYNRPWVDEKLQEIDCQYVNLTNGEV